MAIFATNSSGAIWWPNLQLMQVTESISGSVVPLAMFNGKMVSQSQNTSPVSNTKSVSSVLSEYALEKRFMILKIYEPLMEYWAEVWKTLINQLSRQSNALNADWTWKMLDNPRFFGQFTTFAFLERHSQKRRINGKHWAVYRDFLLAMGNNYLRGKLRIEQNAPNYFWF